MSVNRGVIRCTQDLISASWILYTGFTNLHMNEVSGGTPRRWHSSIVRKQASSPMYQWNMSEMAMTIWMERIVQCAFGQKGTMIMNSTNAVCSSFIKSANRLFISKSVGSLFNVVKNIWTQPMTNLSQQQHKEWTHRRTSPSYALHIKMR